MATKLAPHLNSDELRERYDSTSNPVERTRFHALWLLSQGRRRGEVAALVGKRPNWISVTLRRYKERGPDGLGDGRHSNRGQIPLLSEAQEAALEHALLGTAPDDTPWSGPKVARWMSAQLGKLVHPQRGWEALCRHGYSPQRPRPRHREADADAQESFPSGVSARRRSRHP